MKDLDWGAIGAIGTITGVVITLIIGIIPIFKKEKPTNDNRTSQNVKGLFFFKNDISQNVEKKD